MRKLELLVDGNPTPLRFTLDLKVSMPIDLILIVLLFLYLIRPDSFVGRTRAAIVDSVVHSIKILL